MKLRTIILAFAVACGVSALSAADPSWWAAAEIEAGTAGDNYVPANLGQLKYVAKKAKAHLDANLTGGSGAPINSLVAAFEPRSGMGYTQPQIDAFIAANYAPVNLGQLKAVAKPFYDRLIAGGYSTKANLIARGLTGWTGDYPWLPSTPVANNYAPANLGQLKLVFSFDLAGFTEAAWETDSDEDGIADGWEAANFAALTSAPGGDADGDGWSNLTEYLLQTDPNHVESGSGVEFNQVGLVVFTPLH